MMTSHRYTWESLPGIMTGRGSGDPGKDMEIRYLLTDSRQLGLARQTLFFAIRTQKNDGHRYIPELLEKGVRLFVTERVDPAWTAACPDAGFIRVESPLAALQKLAAFHRRRFQLPVVAITGSNGKTIIKEWLVQLLSEPWRVVRNPGSFNSQTGVPLSVWQMGAQDTLGVFEAGISEPGEMDRLRQVLRPDIGIFTNIGPAHDAGFASRQEKVREKMKLFEGAATLICCADQGDVIREVPPGPVLMSWGRGPGARVQVQSVRRDQASSRIGLRYEHQEFEFEIPFTDEASAENAIHCACLMLHLGMEGETIRRRMSGLQPVAMRLELKQGIHHSLVINDTYNSDLGSLDLALDFLNSQAQGRQTTLILSDILQTGLPPQTLYARVAELLRAKSVGRLIGVGPGISGCAACFDLPARYFPDTESLLGEQDFSSLQDQAILVKGARPFGFERVSDRLQQKDHQTILEINLEALVHNLNVFRALLRPGVRTMGMVKAFSYGSGSAEIAGVLQYHRVDCLAVAYADEGKALRQGGITLPIVVMNPELRDLDILDHYRLEPEVYSMELLHRLARRKEHGRTLPIHLKVDTGMHRLGFLPGQLPGLLAFLGSAPGLKVASVFSHFAASDDPRHDAFTREQLQAFTQACATLEAGLGHSFLRHISNSAAVARFPEAQLDMVRLGIGLYGVSPDAGIQERLQQVSTFRSVVSQVKHVGKGGTVGYDRAWKAREPREVAVVPVGYADGLHRRLGNGRGHLLVGGRAVPLVGNISMDMCTVDVTGLGVSPGDEVIVFGPERPVTELAREMGTIPYEVLTSVSQRVKRVYYQ